MHEIIIEQTFEQPLSKVFAAMSTHDSFNRIFAPIQVERIQSGSDPQFPDGTGSIRRMGFGPIKPIQEQITAYVPNQLIEYRLINNRLVRQHLGSIRFTALSDRVTRVSYRIGLTTTIPFAERLILPQLRMAIQRGLRSLAHKMAKSA